MFSQKSSKSKHKFSVQRIKKQKPKPEWTTDFVDRSQFKLSQAEMIQKKAALQSKHRQEARLQLQQRRRKLQQGIIDQQTRKIYQTALTSKKIDINPPIRKNLTEMIRYEKQIKERMQEQFDQNQQQNGYNSDNEEQNYFQQQANKEIKEAQDFIKKFQKAKKQQKIQRAVQMLTKEKTKSNENNKKYSKNINNNNTNNKDNFIEYMTEGKYSSINQSRNKGYESSQDQAISSIQETIKFMQQKLFAAKKIVDQHSKSFIQDSNNNDDNNFVYKNDDNDESFTKYNKKQQPNMYKKKQAIQKKVERKDDSDDQMQFGERLAEISQLRIKIKQQNQNSSDDECMDTIRRMRQLMEEKQIEFQTFGNKKGQSLKMKQNITDNLSPSYNYGALQCNSTIQKNSQNFTDSEAEVSFNLTANQDLSYQFQSFPIKSKKSDNIKKQISSRNNWQINDMKKSKQYEDEYQKIKQNLFNCINKQSDTDEESQDSLLVKNRINMWKKQLQPQIEPEDNEDDEDRSVRTTNLNNFNNIHNGSTKRMIIKQNDQNEQQEEQQQSYKYNYFSDNNIKKTNNFIQTSSSADFSKKPPLIKKTPQDNTQFNTLKNMISNASSQIQKIDIQPLKIEPVNQTEGMIGFDFRGSINIKKNVLMK